MDSGLPRSFWEQQTSELKASADRHCPPRSGHAVGSLPLGRWDPHCPPQEFPFPRSELRYDMNFSLSPCSPCHLCSDRVGPVKGRPQVPPLLTGGASSTDGRLCFGGQHSKKCPPMSLLLFNIPISPRSRVGKGPQDP